MTHHARPEMTHLSNVLLNQHAAPPPSLFWVHAPLKQSDQSALTEDTWTRGELLATKGGFIGNKPLWIHHCLAIAVLIS